MSRSVDVVFTYTPDEYKQAMRRHFTTVLRVRRDLIAGVVGIVAGLSISLLSDAAWIGWTLVAGSAVLLAMVAYAFFLLPTMIYKSQPKLKNPYHLSFFDDGIRFETDGVDSTLKWSVYESWLSDESFYILYHGKRDLSVIPRRALTADDADNRLRELIERKLGPART